MTNSKDPSIPDITEEKFDMDSPAEYRITASFSIQKAGVPYPCDTIHACSDETAILTMEQARGAINTFLQVMALVGIIPYLQQREAELKELFEKANKAGLISEDGSTVINMQEVKKPH